MNDTKPIPEAWGHIPDELKALRQWVCYRIEEPHGKPTKIPYRIDKVGRGNARSNDPSTWHTYEDVVESYVKTKNNFDGIGFILAEFDPYVFIDLDHVVHDGVLEPWAQELIDRVDSYTEYSQSGTGIHIIAKAKKPGPRCRIQSKPQFEIYESVRLVVFTGNVLPGSPTQITDAQDAVNQIYFEVFGDNPKNVPKKESHRNAKPIGMSDPVLIQKAMSASNKDKFSRLWNGNIGEYNGDASAADMAMCCILAYWTDKDPLRIDRLFRESGLMRDKWDEHRGDQTYAQMTINAAIDMTKESYSDHISTSKSKRKPNKSSPDPEDAPCGPDGEPMNDLGNARRLVKKHGDTIRYCHDAGKWYCWDGKHWVKDGTGEIIRKAKSIVDDMLRQAVAMRSAAESSSDDGSLEAARAFERHAVSSGNHRRIIAMISQAESEAGVTINASDLDADPWAFNVSNGTIDLRTGELHPHNRDDLISKISDIPYDPDVPCPIWEQFITSIFKDDPDLIHFVHQACGYTLTGDTREQVFFILHGCGSNGKSTFINVLRDILGDYETKTSTDTLVEKKNASNTNDLAALQGARLVSAIETSAGKRLAEALVKEMTGQDAVTARFLYQEFFTFVPVFKLWLACNHVPIIHGQDHGIWRRIRLVPFDVQFQDPDQPVGPYKDKDLPEKLKSEYQGILAWLVHGCLDWQNNGLSTANAVRTATGKLQQDMDVLGGFLTECCVFERNVQATAKDLYAAYCAWAESNGEKPLSQRWFGLRLSERGSCSKFKGAQGVRCWSGIGLVNKNHQDIISNSVAHTDDVALSTRESLCARESKENINPIGGYRQEMPQSPFTPQKPKTIILADGTEFTVPEDDDLDWTNGEVI